MKRELKPLNELQIGNLEILRRCIDWEPARFSAKYHHLVIAGDVEFAHIYKSVGEALVRREFAVAESRIVKQKGGKPYKVTVFKITDAGRAYLQTVELPDYMREEPAPPRAKVTVGDVDIQRHEEGDQVRLSASISHLSIEIGGDS